MHKLGLKLWSSNLFYINAMKELYSQGVFDYVELYVVPGSVQKVLGEWEKIDIPFFLHAPHSYSGFNFSLKEYEEKNRTLIQEVILFQKKLKPQKVIFHPGIEGSLEETMRQISFFQKEYKELFNKVVIENKPRVGLKGERCIGSSPEEMKEILDKTGMNFCLDIGHAICYAAWGKKDYKGVIDQFMKLAPKMFHLSDGDINSPKDRHLNFGTGNFPLDKLIQMIPEGIEVSIETNKKSKLNLDDFEKDISYFRKWT